MPTCRARSIGIQAAPGIREGADGPLDARVITLAAGKVDIVFHPRAARAVRGVSTRGTRVNPWQPCSHARGAQAPLRTAVMEHQGQRLQLSALGTIHTLSAPGCVLRFHVQ